MPTTIEELKKWRAGDLRDIIKKHNLGKTDLKRAELEQIIINSGIDVSNEPSTKKGKPAKGVRRVRVIKKKKPVPEPQALPPIGDRAPPSDPKPTGVKSTKEKILEKQLSNKDEELQKCKDELEKKQENIRKLRKVEKEFKKHKKKEGKVRPPKRRAPAPIEIPEEEADFAPVSPGGDIREGFRPFINKEGRLVSIDEQLERFGLDPITVAPDVPVSEEAISEEELKRLQGLGLDLFREDSPVPAPTSPSFLTKSRVERLAREQGIDQPVSPQFVSPTAEEDKPVFFPDQASPTTIRENLVISTEDDKIELITELVESLETNEPVSIPTPVSVAIPQNVFPEDVEEKERPSEEEIAREATELIEEDIVETVLDVEDENLSSIILEEILGKESTERIEIDIKISETRRRLKSKRQERDSAQDKGKLQDEVEDLVDSLEELKDERNRLRGSIVEPKGIPLPRPIQKPAQISPRPRALTLEEEKEFRRRKQLEEIRRDPPKRRLVPLTMKEVKEITKRNKEERKKTREEQSKKRKRSTELLDSIDGILIKNRKEVSRDTFTMKDLKREILELGFTKEEFKENKDSIRKEVQDLIFESEEPEDVFGTLTFVPRPSPSPPPKEPTPPPIQTFEPERQKGKKKKKKGKVREPLFGPEIAKENAERKAKRKAEAEADRRKGIKDKKESIAQSALDEGFGTMTNNEFVKLLANKSKINKALLVAFAKKHFDEGELPFGKKDRSAKKVAEALINSIQEGGFNPEEDYSPEERLEMLRELKATITRKEKIVRKKKRAKDLKGTPFTEREQILLDLAKEVKKKPTKIGRRGEKMSLREAALTIIQEIDVADRVKKIIAEDSVPTKQDIIDLTRTHGQFMSEELEIVGGAIWLDKIDYESFSDEEKKEILKKMWESI